MSDAFPSVVSYSTDPIALRWIRPAAADEPADNFRRPALQAFQATGLTPPSRAPQREPFEEQAELYERQQLSIWLLEQGEATGGKILMLDQLVPGVAYVPGPPKATGSETVAVRTGWVRDWKWLPKGVRVPTHAAWLLAAWLRELGVAVDIDRPPWMSVTPALRDALPPIPSLSAEVVEAATVVALEEIDAAGLVRMRTRAGEPLALLPWQRISAGLSRLGYWKRLAMFFAPGAGKTASSLLWLAAKPRPLLVLTPSQVKSTWAREIAQYAPGMDAFVWTAPSLRRKRDRTLDEWESACRETGKLPVLIVGHETMVDAWQSGDVYRLVTKPVGDESGKLDWNPWAPPKMTMAPYPFDANRRGPGVAVVLDEGHLFRNPKRWKGILNPDGSLRFEARQTATGQMAETFALMEIGRWSTARCVLSGTPIANRLDQFWVLLDWLDGAGGFGSFYQFVKRYCQGRVNEHGGWEMAKLEPGELPPNAGELRSRLQWLAYEVPYSVSHAALPPKRRETVYLPPSEQVQELGSWTSLIKEAAKHGPNAIIEAQRMRAASRKRKAIVKDVLTALGEGQKVLVFTGRRKDVEYLRDAIVKGLGSAVGIWGGHGGMEYSERDTFREAYMTWRPEEHRTADGSPTGCCLVGTTESFGIGVDLQDTDLLCFAMTPATWAELWQAEQRVSRWGMTRDVLIRFYIAEGTIDEALAASFLDKLPAIAAMTADEEIAGVGESLAGLSDPEALLQSVWDKIAGVDKGIADSETLATEAHSE